MATANQDFVTYAGNAVSPIFTVRDAAGVAVDISTVSDIQWIARRTLSDAAVLSLSKIGGNITFVTNGTDGKFQVHISKTNTTSLSGSYIHQATIVDAGGDPTTVTVGRMQVGLAPAWTYDATAIGTSTLYQVRRLVGDVLVNDQQLLDEEVNFTISQYSNIYLAAAECCRNIAAQYSRKVDTVQGDIRTLYSSQARAYAQRAIDLEQRGMGRGAGAMPYAGAMTTADKGAQVADTSRVTPQFNIGMFDSLLPIGIGSNNETPGNPSGGNGDGTEGSAP